MRGGLKLPYDPYLIGSIIFVALAFDFVNGFHDCANAIATVVATRVLSPLQAVSLAAVFNLIGPLFFTTAIAMTVGKGIIAMGVITPYLILAALSGAILWDLVTWWWGFPSSSSHALIGGLVGAGIAAAGTGAIIAPPFETVLELGAFLILAGLAASFIVATVQLATRGRLTGRVAGLSFVGGAVAIVPVLVFSGILKVSGLLAVIVFMVVSPLVGLGVSFLFAAFVMRAFRSSHPGKLNRYFRRLQLISAAFYSLTHGTNDAQKTMGIITVLLVAGGFLVPGAGGHFEVPLWVILAAHIAISLGTFFGGWRIVKTMAHRITKLRPYQGFCAESAGGGVLSFMAFFGVPVSTTHAISGAIMGVGAAQNAAAVKWGVTRKIIGAWIFTVPTSALVAGLSFLLIRAFGVV